MYLAFSSRTRKGFTRRFAKKKKDARVLFAEAKLSEQTQLLIIIKAWS